MNHHAPLAWEQGNVIEYYAPNHLVRCTICNEPIEAGDLFRVILGRPSHPACPRNRSHLRVVQ